MRIRFSISEDDDAIGWRLGAASLLVVLFSGCVGPAIDAVDTEGHAIAHEKLAEVESFRTKLVVLSPEESETDGEDRQSATDAVASDIEVPAVLKLDDALEIATKHNREYQSERESLFLGAIALGVTRRDFLRPVFSGAGHFQLTDGKSLDYSDVTSLSLGGSQLFATGGRLDVDLSAVLARDGTGGRDQQSTTGATATFSQPLLRGAGREAAFESLTSAERQLLYDARAFELFREGFAISTIQRYYGLVVQKKKLVNTRNRIEWQEFALNQAQALHEVGRGSKLDVFRAEQSLLSARSNVLDAEQSYRIALDRFKIELGLSTDVEFSIGEETPTIEAIDVDLERAVRAALHNRLDLATTRDELEDQRRRVRIAKNGLLPDVSLSASYAVDSNTRQTFAQLRHDDSQVVVAGIDVEIPLDRRRERQLYRAALIGLDATRRALQQREDEIIVEVRDAIGDLRRTREQLGIAQLEIESLEKSVEKAQIDLEAGSVTNRDVVEAKDELTVALNRRLDLLVDYEIGRLTLLRVTGLLFIDRDGKVTQ